MCVARVTLEEDGLTSGRYGYQTPSKLRLILTIAMVDAVIKDSDILAVRKLRPQRLADSPDIPVNTQSRPPDYVESLHRQHLCSFRPHAPERSGGYQARVVRDELPVQDGRSQAWRAA